MDIKKITIVDDLISSGRGGTPKSMAEKLGISQRMLYLILNHMKNEMNAPIKYDKKRMRYYYDRPGTLNLKWKDSV